MSQAKHESPTRSGDSRVQELKSSAHLMSLETGIYCLVNGSTQPATGVIAGVRVSPVDPTDANITISSFRADGWLNGAGDAALIRVVTGPAQIMVTIYQSESGAEPPPKIRVLRLSEQLPAGAPAAEPAAVAPRRPVMVLTEQHDVIVHVQRVGDVGKPFGDWAGNPGSQFAIEGFTIAVPAGLSPSDLSYQAVLGRGWLSPWAEAGQFCGSRGMALPLLGLKVKLSDSAARRYDLTYEASFLDGSRIGPLHSEESCETEGLSPLEAIRIMLVEKSTAATPVRTSPIKAAPVKAVPKAPATPPKPIAKAKPVAAPAKPKPTLRRR